jgi:hypothetical protein
MNPFCQDQPDNKFDSLTDLAHLAKPLLDTNRRSGELSADESALSAVSA